MKKAMSVLLALVMVLSMIPGAAPAVSAAGTEEPLQAYYTNESVSVDGALREEHWLLRDKIGSTPHCAAECAECPVRGCEDRGKGHGLHRQRQGV